MHDGTVKVKLDPSQDGDTRRLWRKMASSYPSLAEHLHPVASVAQASSIVEMNAVLPCMMPEDDRDVTILLMLLTLIFALFCWIGTILGI